MLTPDHIKTLEVAAQNILDQQPFEDIRQSIDQVANMANDELGQFRIRKIPVGGAFAHVIVCRVIEDIENQALPAASEGTGIAAYERYTTLTSDVERSVGKEMIPILQAKEGTFSRAFTYFDQHMQSEWERHKAHPEQINRLGKTTTNKPPVTQQLLANLVANNTINISTSLVILRATQICRQEGQLPPAEELGSRLRKIHAAEADLAYLPNSMFNHVVLGRELAQKHFRHIRYENNNEFGLRSWSRLLRECLETGSLPSLASDLSPALEAPSSYIDTVRVAGHCAAQLWLRAMEPPQQPYTAGHAVAHFFERQGIELQDNTFRVVDYQLLRNIEVAERTIFADNDCRAALQLMALL